MTRYARRTSDINLTWFLGSQLEHSLYPCANVATSVDPSLARQNLAVSCSGNILLGAQVFTSFIYTTS